mgnify:CR=1 FL=1
MHLIDSLIRQEIGLDSASIGSSLIERTVRLRMKSLGLKKDGDYRRLLDETPAEWEELVEAVVVTGQTGPSVETRRSAQSSDRQASAVAVGAGAKTPRRPDLAGRAAGR